ncbi:VOC family protein [Sulfitobacter donghicola]|uniref:Glyoxalase n=1 Tax=Sulfitobacter donghicola DSW-25 = KCTC 12864 = JCM 14565 TaxID=1300350 RepID=A0A073IRQ1_9RHOB|nr:VOC family protein [Sulfitobacter donghicola]KEJ88052.1 glyoxalase [Sulfitobacter donghicola DSW-25 = KCTC 12864 = JCM 14565]KIN68733.1 Glyoxalase/bleomycin resistance protein/dioxygenase [Sulfitobacter donghicola DSW-25 = KCTC 12864 = JCM 14565]
MAVKRIVSNIATGSVEELRRFYADLFDLDLVMDFGWIATLAGEDTAAVQLSIASQGGSGTQVPDLSIEVDNLDELYQRAQKMGAQITYELTDEPWGVRRFYLKDPAGKTINVLAHTA